jgi:hypothetical protein
VDLQDDFFVDTGFLDSLKHDIGIGLVV